VDRKKLSPASTVDEYLEMLPPEERNALQRLRLVIKSLVPGVKERIAYQVPVFSLGRDLIGFSAQNNHLSLYTMSPALVKTMGKDVKDFKVSGATIHFSPEEPLPKTLIRKIVENRLREVQTHTL
jgi:uncharacterized protein YdhG (YjbR/CyaY superfamily)